jgi:predicted nucleic acid-binding protein
VVEGAVIYWDSSAIIKWYIGEDGSSFALEWRKKAKFHHTAAISHAEVLAGLQRLKRENLITEMQLRECLVRFHADFRKMLILDYSATVRKVAEEIAGSVALRGADLVQLASAVRLLREGITTALATFDGVLANAARDCQLRVLDA